ncbi:hypothetical protein [Dyadobacter sp. NIV53]|uniref:hypothetical protein n=1 Tax=Dyadobacter sp. NIV53 TaxID=2861765 RepID=UPI001C87135B|nr:hypothetical protein [Dyadobacter sp. NIV53]
MKDQLQNFLYFCNLSIGVENDFELFPELIQNYVSGNRRTPHISKVFVLNNNDINAFAGIRDGKSIIGVFSGFPLLLNSFFLSILADETIFNNMDDVYHLNPKAFNVKELVDETSNNSIYNREFIENNWQVIRNSIPRAHPNNLINWTNSKLIINRNRANLALQLAQQAAFSLLSMN